VIRNFDSLAFLGILGQFSNPANNQLGERPIWIFWQFLAIFGISGNFELGNAIKWQI